MTDTPDPLDLTAVYNRWIDWYNNQVTTADWAHRDPEESLSHCLAREDIPALMAEVRRLREESVMLRAAAEERDRYRSLYRSAFTENVRVRRQIEEKTT